MHQRGSAITTVSPPRRWLLHRRVAQGLELLHAEDIDMVAAQLAAQYAAGGRPSRAVAYYRRAADVAAGVFAHAEAIRLHQEALSVIRSLPAGRERDRQELAVLEALAAPLNARYGYSSPDLRKALERSVELAESLGQRNSTLTGMVEAARSSCAEATELARSTGHPYNLAMALAYAAITHQLRRDAPALQHSVGELRELCDRYDFAYYREWGLILDGWSRHEEPDIWRGINNLKSAGSFARMPYWLSLLADVLARKNRSDAARATLDAAVVAGHAYDDLWWLPEVMRMRAAYDEDEGTALSRLRSAAQMASAHGSVALLGRCEHDLAERGVRHKACNVPPIS